jgi:predicted PurR-regulated permease PerM
VFDPTKVPWIASALTWLDTTFGINLAQVRGYVIEGSRAVLQSLASLGGKVFLGAIGTVFGFVLMVFLLFFIIRDAPHVANAA